MTAEPFDQIREALRDYRRVAEEYGGLLGNPSQARAIDALALLDSLQAEVERLTEDQEYIERCYNELPDADPRKLWAENERLRAEWAAENVERTNALMAAEARIKELEGRVKMVPNQPLLNAARRLVLATDNAERNYALAEFVAALDLGEIEELVAKLASAEAHISWLHDEDAALEADRDRWQAIAERLGEALDFYAQQRGLGSVLASDGGMKARAALDEMKAGAEDA